MKPADDKTLAAASVSALKWEYAGSAARAVSSIVITVVLARVLGPEPFGLAAAAWLVIGFGNLIADLGMGSALLQRKVISDDDVRYAFTMQTCVGILLLAVTALAAPVMAQIFDEPKVIPIVRAMSLVFVLQAFGGIAVCLLKRKLDFRRIQIARISSYVTGFLGLGIPLALLGFGVWSLIIAQLFQTTLFSLLCYGYVRHPIKPLFALPTGRLREFGLKVLSTNIVNYVLSNIDTFFIGHFFDVMILGLYNRAYVLVSMPMNSVVAAVQQVSFSVYSRMQDDPSRVRSGYLAGIGFMTMLMLPTYACIALVPATVVDGLFGSQWRAAIPFLVPLALAMPFHAVMATGGPMLWANDRVGREFIAQLAIAIILPLVLFAASSISALAVVWGVFGVTILRFVLITHASLRIVEASWSRLIRPTCGSMGLLVVTGGSVYLTDWALQFSDLSASGRLAADILVGASVFLGTALISTKLIFSPEMDWLAKRASEQLPTWIGPLVKRVSRSAAVPV